MKVAVNIFPLNSAHKNRGIGYYTQNLVDKLKEDKEIELQPFNNISEVRDADVVHYPWFDFFFNTLPQKKVAPVVVTVHDVIPLLFKDKYPVGIKGKINYFLQTRSLKRCDAVITDSNTSKIDISKHLKIESEKINTIYLAADSDFRVLSENKCILIKKKYMLSDRYLLYVGDANWIKNLPLLIEAFKELIKDKSFSDVKLLLVGGVFLKKVEDINHPELESLKITNRMIKNFQLEDKIIRPGSISKEDLVGLYNLATVYIQPSLYEGFGLPVLQALACGTPVISSSAGSLKEVGGSAAIYFNPNNVSGLVALVKEVLQSKSLQNKLNKLGLSQAQKFSWDKCILETKAVYSKILKNV